MVEAAEVAEEIKDFSGKALAYGLELVLSELELQENPLFDQALLVVMLVVYVDLARILELHFLKKRIITLKLIIADLIDILDDLLPNILTFPSYLLVDIQLGVVGRLKADLRQAEGQHIYRDGVVIVLATHHLRYLKIEIELREHVFPRLVGIVKQGVVAGAELFDFVVHYEFHVVLLKLLQNQPLKGHLLLLPPSQFPG